MERIKTYKAITFQELLYGYKLMDLAFVLLFAFFITFFISIPVGILSFFLLLFFFKRYSTRRENYFKNYFVYLFTPKKLSVKQDKIKPYKDYINGSNKAKTY